MRLKGCDQPLSRKGLNSQKEEFATDRDINTLAEAMVGADVFLGLSVRMLVTTEMVQSMAEKPIVFALANPDPEISYEAAMASRPDLIFATGRSDYPNQINNALGFPLHIPRSYLTQARQPSTRP